MRFPVPPLEALFHMCIILKCFWLKMINLDCTLWKPKCCLVPLDISDDEIPNMSMSREKLCSHLRSLKC